ncbi:GUN4 domain-containing protein [Spirulina subsalsa]|uniref:GUN4 domain-containing protein n=1 Tax=Spirulina subsalsa TaxID=54311 RepID=UPI00030F0AD0|nr:GUN4 domain-containing protein [Spirulina subsalsa]
MTPQDTPSPEKRDIEALRQQLTSGKTQKQYSAIAQLAQAGDTGLTYLMDYWREQPQITPSPLLGKIHQTLYAAKTPATENFLRNYLPSGLVPLKSDRQVDYQPLAQHLIAQEFLEGDRLSLQKLCEAAGEAAQNRKWLYFSEVDKIPVTDFHTVNTLWLTYSEGKFGYSIQRELWLAQGKDFSKLWDKIGWRKDNNWTRYPNEFIWDLSAPKGHLPLSNQLRGVRTFEAILRHPAWAS